MLKLKTKTTQKKFYNKWLYKITLTVQGSGIFRMYSLDQVIEFCKKSQPDGRAWSVFSKAYANKDFIQNLATFLKKYQSDLWSKRIENSQIDFYTNDKDFYDNMAKEFEEHVYHMFEPDSNLLKNLDHNSIMVKKLPHNKFNYKVFLLPHKLKFKKEEKEKYINWLEAQGSRVTCTSAIKKWFISTDWNWDRRYILVEDERTLLMLKLRNPEVVGRIYNFQIIDK